MNWENLANVSSVFDSQAQSTEHRATVPPKHFPALIWDLIDSTAVCSSFLKIDIRSTEPAVCNKNNLIFTVSVF